MLQFDAFAAIQVGCRSDAAANYRVSAKRRCSQVHFKHAFKFNDVISQDDGTLILDLRTVTEIFRRGPSPKF